MKGCSGSLPRAVLARHRRRPHGSTESEAAQWGDTMKCLFRGREIDSATDPEYLAGFAEITSKIAPYDYEPDREAARRNTQGEPSGAARESRILALSLHAA